MRTNNIMDKAEDKTRLGENKDARLGGEEEKVGFSNHEEILNHVKGTESTVEHEFRKRAE